jgi:hypothetical protein
MVRLSRRREIVKKAVKDRGDCIRVACVAFGISESCYCYERKRDAENDEAANWLIRLIRKLPHQVDNSKLEIPVLNVLGMNSMGVL